MKVSEILLEAKVDFAQAKTYIKWVSGVTTTAKEPYELPGGSYGFKLPGINEENFKKVSAHIQKQLGIKPKVERDGKHSLMATFQIDKDRLVNLVLLFNQSFTIYLSDDSDWVPENKTSTRGKSTDPKILSINLQMKILWICNI